MTHNQKPSLRLLSELKENKFVKKDLLDFSGYETINEAKAILGLNKASDVYHYLIKDYNDTIKEINKGIIKKFQKDNDKYLKFKFDKEQIELKEKKEQNKQQQIVKQQKTKIIKKINNEFERLVQGQQTNIVLNLPELYKYFTLKDIIELIIKMSNQKTGKHILLTIGNIEYTLSDKTKSRLINFMLNNQYNEIGGEKSDEDIRYELANNSEIIISVVEDKHKNKKDNGAFFPYTHKLEGIDLTELDIYEKFKATNYIDNCLMKALYEGGLEEEKVNKLYTYVKNRKIPKCDLKKLCQDLEIQIRLKQNNSHDKVEIYGAEFEDFYNIGLIEDHYFNIQDISITSYAIENYEKIKHLPNWNKIYKICSKGYFERSDKKFIDSFKVVKLLVEHKATLLVALTFDNSNIASSQFYDKIDDQITDLKYKQQLLHSHLPVIGSEKTNKPKGDIPWTKVWIDFEAYTDIDKKHIPYMCCSIDEAGVEKTFYGKSCAYKLLESLTTNTILIAHNATYDYRFLVQYLFITNEISKGTHLISAEGKFGQHQIQVKDSYNLITMPLRSFPETFKIKDTIKEVMPYSLYNIVGNIEKRFIPLQECLSFIKIYQKNHYIQNCKKWDCLKFGNVDIIKYSEMYCKIDCKILKQGYETFRSWIH